MKKTDFSQFQIEEGILLDEEEKQLLSGIKGSKSILTKKLVSHYSETAKAQKNRNKNVSMRLSGEDLLRVKAKSVEEGIPYQVLLAGVIHKWIHGKLKEA
ncbi:MAG: hypothetical protein KBD83_07555 [Gammaproteobacteria bacterium]|nr:hypothetical protein [Gammaproteobacteria bacterium]